jgi:predicted ATPase
MASALRLEIRSDNPLPGLIAALRDTNMLLVFDNCEHVIEAAATLISTILKGARGVHVIATSREPLRIEGERVYRLPALESPDASVGLSAAEALGFTAIQLFVERAAAATNDFELSDADAASAARICRELDGNPLAIELAAGRVDTFGVQGLAIRLEDRLRLLADSHRGTLPRHRTISEALDWSYQLLSPTEQIVFRRLAIFAGGFTAEAAGAVTADADNRSDIGTSIASLVMKSLVTAEIGDGEVRYRLLEIARAFALAKLIENDEVDAIARRHAIYYRDALEAKIDVAGAYVPEFDNIRSALTWTFAPGGDQSIAVALAAASAPIWLEMSLLTECRSWTGQALAILDASDRGTHREMVLQTEFGLALMYTLGAGSAAREALLRASDLAERLRESGYGLRAIAGLTNLCLRLEDFRGALALAQRAENIAKDSADPVAASTADVLFSASLVCLGEYARSMSYAQRAIRGLQSAERRRPAVRAGIDHIIHARTNVATILWLQGLLDQSSLAAQSIMDDAEAGEHAATRCFALTWCACSRSLQIGEIENAERSVALLKDCSDKHISWPALSNPGPERRACDVESGLSQIYGGLRQAKSSRCQIASRNMGRLDR